MPRDTLAHRERKGAPSARQQRHKRRVSNLVLRLHFASLDLIRSIRDGKHLLTTDGSDDAQDATSLVARLPRAEKLELTVLTVIVIPFIDNSFFTGDWALQLVVQEKAVALDAFRKTVAAQKAADRLQEAVPYARVEVIEQPMPAKAWSDLPKTSSATSS